MHIADSHCYRIYTYLHHLARKLKGYKTVWEFDNNMWPLIIGQFLRLRRERRRIRHARRRKRQRGAGNFLRNEIPQGSRVVA